MPISGSLGQPKAERVINKQTGQTAGNVRMMTHSRRTFLKAAGAAALIPMAPALGQSRHIDDLIDYDATGLAALLRSRQISQAELVEVIIRRIEVMNPALGFMTNETFDRARQKAGTIPMDTPFAGVPMLMKDMIDVGGVPRTDGSRMFLDNIPKENVAYVDGVEAAGFNILGMTNVPKLASSIITSNEVFGPTRNPWNLDYSAYGSSGGAAVAVAAGVIPLAHGTDGAGSNRLPPSATGVFGMKPSRERMLSGEADGSHDIAKTNQMISRTVRDSVQAFVETEDRSGRVFEPVGLVDRPLRRRLRIGLTIDDGILGDIEPEVRDVQLKTAALLENLGHSVEETRWPVDADVFGSAYVAFFSGKVGPLAAAFSEAGTTPSESGMLTPLLASFLEALQGRFSADEIAASGHFIDGLSKVFDDALHDFDVLLAPVSARHTPRLDDHSPREGWSDEIEDWMKTHLKFTGPVNFAGNPAMSVPLYWSPTLDIPIGSHFIAATGDDRLLYELALELEQARPWRDIWAPYSLKHIPV